jgi:hypothetical protein
MRGQWAISNTPSTSKLNTNAETTGELTGFDQKIIKPTVDMMEAIMAALRHHAC